MFQPGLPHALVLSATPSAWEVAVPSAVAAWPAAEPCALPPLLAEPSTLELAAAPALLAVACRMWWVGNMGRDGCVAWRSMVGARQARQAGRQAGSTCRQAATPC